MPYMATTTRTKKYKVTFFLNGQTFEKRTNDVEQAIMDIKPDVLLTEMYVQVKRIGMPNADTVERRLNLIRGKQLFNNDDFRKVFIINLLLD